MFGMPFQGELIFIGISRPRAFALGYDGVSPPAQEEVQTD
jgi:hypothetical protein